MGSLYAYFVIFESLTFRKAESSGCRRQALGFRGGIAVGNVGALESLRYLLCQVTEQ